MLAIMDPVDAEDSIVAPIAVGRESRGSTTDGGLKRRMAKQLPRVLLVAKKVGRDHLIIGAMMLTECCCVEGHDNSYWTVAAFAELRSHFLAKTGDRNRWQHTLAHLDVKAEQRIRMMVTTSGGRLYELPAGALARLGGGR